MGIRRRQVVIASAVIVAALAYFVVTGMRDTMVYYYTVDEVAARQAELVGEPLRIAGKVVPGTIESSGGNLVNRFVIEENGARLAVVYRGVAPDTFVDEAEAVVEGRLGEDGVFEATFLMAKCPSKYEAEADYAQYREAGVTAPAAAE